ncbi:MAG: tRNA (adenosine(37)-N6)-dimethylallyltransferase MiaA [Patescibacteria group bacterium]|nr:tRNA (adenosine(37)-N6)-dimethylallyltransferase MiaA [Patescibacteria group bacterium]
MTDKIPDTIKKPKIIVILGPTASGKSDLAVEIAKKISGEIISADSRQIYKGMNIGAGKITKKEMRGIPHYLLDVASPKRRRPFTASDYRTLAKKAVKKIITKGKTPIICGGTGFYIDSLIYDYQFPKVLPDKKLRMKLEKESAADLFKKLERLDPQRAKNIDRFNKRRLIRALEIIITTKKPVPPIQKSSPYDIIKIGIKREPRKLKNLISLRLEKRLKAGMINEIKKLHRQGVSWQKLDDFGLEYRFISRYLRGLISKKEMIERLEKEIAAYAKRQMTWFRRDKNIQWVKNSNEALMIIKRFLK